MAGPVDLSRFLPDRPTIDGYRGQIRLPVEATKTYEIRTARETHTRPATCVEVDCRNRTHGWLTVADERTGHGRAVASEVRRWARPVAAVLSPAVAARVRRYVESRGPDGSTHFAFPAGQECFTSHTVRVDRPALFIVRDGDIRGNPRGTPERRHVRGADWVEDSALHQQAIQLAHQRG